MTSSDQDLVAAFLAKQAITQCPTRVGRGQSVDWLGWEPDTAETPIPPIGKVRRIIGDQRRAHQAALAARLAGGR